MTDFSVYSWSATYEPVVMWMIHMKLPTNKGDICLRCCNTLFYINWKMRNWSYFKVFQFYFLNEHKTVICGTVVLYIVHTSTETAPPDAPYRVWVCAVGSCRRCMRRITRGAQVELDWCILSVCVFGGGNEVLCFCLFSCASCLWKYESSIPQYIVAILYNILQYSIISYWSFAVSVHYW